MDELENAVRESLRRAVANKPPLGPIDLDEVAAAGVRPKPGGALRWLAAVAAVALVAGVGIAAWSSRGGGATQAVPQATPSVAPTQAGLVGTRWVAIRIQNQAVIADDSGAVPYLEFNTDALASAGDPCNVMGGEYSLFKSSLRFTNWTSREVGCGSSLLVAQQVRFEEALRATTTVRRAGDRLDLLDASGVVVLNLTAGRRPGATGTPVAGVSMRFRNSTGFAFDSVRVALAGGDHLVLPYLASGETTPFMTPQPVAPVVAVVVRVGAKEYTYRLPTRLPDPLPAPSLAPGSYTYLLAFSDEGEFMVSFQRDR